VRTSAIDTALADTERSYCRAKATVASIGTDLMSRGPSGALSQRSEFSKAAEQLRHFTGWVYASVRPIAQKIAGQPIRVGRAGSGPKRMKQAPDAEPLDSHPILDLLADPNDLMVAWSLIYSTVASLELTGSSLWWLPEIDGRRQVFPIPTSWIQSTEGTTRFERWLVRPPNHTGEPLPIEADEACYFAYPNPADPHGTWSPLQASGAAVDADESMTASQRSMFARGIHPSHAVIVALPIEADEACYFAYPNPADPHGTWSPLQASGAAVDADESMTASQRSMFARGIHPSHAVIVGKDATTGRRPELNGPQQRQIIRAIRERYASVYNTGEPIILDGLIEDIKRLSNTPQEMDWLSSGKGTKGRITQGFGTNPIIMGELEGANRASALAAEFHFAEFTVNPKIALMSQCLTEWLGPMFGADGERLVVWIEPVVPRDADFELRRYQVLGQFQAVTRNELRAWAGLPAMAGGDKPPGGDMSFERAFSRAVDHRIALGETRDVFYGLSREGAAEKRKNGNGRFATVP